MKHIKLFEEYSQDIMSIPTHVSTHHDVLDLKALHKHVDGPRLEELPDESVEVKKLTPFWEYASRMRTAKVSGIEYENDESSVGFSIIFGGEKYYVMVDKATGGIFVSVRGEYIPIRDTADMIDAINNNLQ